MLSPEARARKYQRLLKPRADKARRLGQCITCFAPCEINPHTGKPYARCKKHRRMAAAVSKRHLAGVRQRWIEAGLCRDCGAPPHVDPQTKKRLKRCFKHLLDNSRHQTARRERLAKETSCPSTP